MAKNLGFGPDSLIRSRPDPKQKWKLPVKYGIHELHFKKFGKVLGEEPMEFPPAVPIEYDEEPPARPEPTGPRREGLDPWQIFWDSDCDKDNPF